MSEQKQATATWQRTIVAVILLAGVAGCGGAEATTATQPQAGGKLPIEVEKGPEDALPKRDQRYVR